MKAWSSLIWPWMWANSLHTLRWVKGPDTPHRHTIRKVAMGTEANGCLASRRLLCLSGAKNIHFHLNTEQGQGITVPDTQRQKLGPQRLPNLCVEYLDSACVSPQFNIRFPNVFGQIFTSHTSHLPVFIHEIAFPRSWSLSLPLPRSLIHSSFRSQP